MQKHLLGTRIKPWMSGRVGRGQRSLDPLAFRYLVNDQRVVSCLTLAVMADGAEVTTIEGLERNGQLDPLQQAFIDEDGFQCGFCTAGQIMSGIGCIREGHASSPE